MSRISFGIVQIHHTHALSINFGSSTGIVNQIAAEPGEESMYQKSLLNLYFSSWHTWSAWPFNVEINYESLNRQFIRKYVVARDFNFVLLTYSKRTVRYWVSVKPHDDVTSDADFTGGIGKSSSQMQMISCWYRSRGPAFAPAGTKPWFQTRINWHILGIWQPAYLIQLFLSSNTSSDVHIRNTDFDISDWPAQQPTSKSKSTVAAECKV